MTANLATVALTDQGRRRALELMALSQYVVRRRCRWKATSRRSANKACAK